MQLIVDQPRLMSSQPDRKLLFGYEIISFLGEGAASALYAVAKPGEGQLYALKHVLRKDDKSQRFVDQLINEYEASKKVNHPNVRKCIEVKTSRTILLQVAEAALVMELLDATPLDHAMMERDEEASLDYILSVMTQTARGMAAINAAGFVHCDMKPGNIMVTPEGQAKVIDLGQACAPGTRKQRVQGSPHFISPEQFRLEPVTFRTDVFNFGATLYWTLTGRHIPTEFTRKQRLAKGRSDDAPPPIEVRPTIPQSLSDLTMQCVRSKIMERPDSMKTIAAQLESIADSMGRTSAVA